MKALFWRDLKLTLAPQNSLLTGLLFFIAIIMMTPFAIGPDPDILARIGPGMLWLGALFAGLLNLNKLFQTDHDDGNLDQFILFDQRQSLALIVFTKCLAHWLGTMLPIIFVTPILAFTLYLDMTTIFATMLTLLCGTPAIIFIGSIGAALAISLSHSTILIFIIILPWTIPIMIFGIATATAPTTQNVSFFTALAFLIAFSLFFSVFSSFVAAITLKYLSE
ncbi:heme exporter protein CcmB [Bartonella bacilliformis str. Heidi Mejia]|uniref:Heme exporter protein B n=2 Tax=Bartonella bacilliformis TaxID=774 RepID=A1UU81_BARBK|nr:heme exporter protein CcmB [Bartonella bacilliformis]ABM45061.1 heme exporter protein CcmB [Bartonella bacilliformis KC583]AMG86255.1 heme exporter protein CcmB [Bartonella bacilliformis]EKS43166.1 heme exporter protein CcmB [Bartonella bacilliformis INS]EYS88946.1 heme exporter protein CcmB [Bartonella bacilliformis San Pedro600-02]EYS90907.1 heme exporter protein CcmB [Bartonella bacilliformis str. Heidi Mejia]